MDSLDNVGESLFGSSDPGFNHERYSVEGILGRGGMGVVYRCHDQKLDKNVAVKVVSWSMDEKKVIRFQKEAQILARLSHPNILNILDFGYTDDGTVYLVTDLLEGRSLTELIEEDGPMVLEDALPVFINMLDGLSHAHNQAGCILHRDIKPSNAMLVDDTREDSNVKILDFGLGKLMDEDQHLTRTGFSLGSPPYMSPEQADTKPVDERSDIYSFGCTMYEILTGRPPFAANNVPATLLKHINEQPPSLAESAEDVFFPDEIERIVAKCLAKSPDDRYQKATQLRADLITLRKTLTQQASILSGVHALSGVLTLTSALSGAYKKLKMPTVATKYVVAAVILLCLIFVGAVYGIKGFRMTPGALDVDAKRAPEIDSMLPAGFETSKPRYEKSAEISSAPAPQLSSNLETTLKGTFRSDSLKGKGSVRLLNLAGCKLTDEGVWSLLKQKQLSSLNLTETNVDDEQLETIGRIKSIEELSLRGCKRITDSGIAHLRSLENLTHIDVSETLLSDSSIETLGQIKGLMSVSASSCKAIKGATLDSLMVNELFLRDSGVKPSNLALLKMPNLTRLDVSGLDISDKGLASLLENKRIWNLDISRNPKITSEGLLSLLYMSSLTNVTITKTPRISEAAIMTFKKGLKRCALVVRTE